MLRGLHFIGAISGGLQRELHVGLACTKPDIADQDFVQFKALPARDFDGVGPTRRRWLDPHLPLTVRCRRRRCGMLADFDPHGVSRFRPSPNRVGLAALEHHVVAEHRTDEGERVGFFGRLGRGTDDDERQQTQNQKGTDRRGRTTNRLKGHGETSRPIEQQRIYRGAAVESIPSQFEPTVRVIDTRDRSHQTPRSSNPFLPSTSRPALRKSQFEHRTDPQADLEVRVNFSLTKVHMLR